MAARRWRVAARQTIGHEFKFRLAVGASAFSAAKAGHTGTLDPLATGLLPLCFGEATKFSSDLLEADKTYEADVLFGVTTDTGDAEGQVLACQPVEFDGPGLEAVLQRFRGPISQVPPMYSALKRDGKPLYELARQGIEVERAARNVLIQNLSCLNRRVIAAVCASRAAKEPTFARWPKISVQHSDVGRI